ncbi:MAG TPA: DUF4188 domain-containing protein [Pseudogracilibacillus sp.]|nr:DUF4188 domain-containing protein [Pseudogracilibacillus sp.]
MAKDINSGRYTTDNEKEIVVFIIGMRVNKWYAVHHWLPIFTAMPPMIKELYTNQAELGFLSMENYFGLRTTHMIQYWKSLDDLLAYARGDKHLKAWKNFNRKAAATSSVGFYHESYQVSEQKYESVYTNMPLYGLSNALGKTPITKYSNGARKRLGDKPPRRFK